jgi:transposase
VVLLTTEERAELEQLTRRGTTEHRIAQRARIVLLKADGCKVWHIARLVGLDRRTVHRRLDAFVDRRLKALHDRPRPGRPRKLSLLSSFSS